MNLTSEDFMLTFINSPLSILTSIILLFTLVVFSRIKETNVLFVYLKFEIFYIFLDCFALSFIPLVRCRNCFKTIDPIFACTLDYFVFNFFSVAIEMASILMSIFATISCILMVGTYAQTSKLSQVLIKTNPNIFALSGFILSVVTFSYQIFAFNANKPYQNITTSIRCEWIDYFQSSPYNILLSASYAFSYGILAFILIVLNGLVLFRIRRNLTNSKSLGIQTPSQRRKDLEQKLTKLIIVDCGNLLAGRVPLLVFMCTNTFFDLSFTKFPFLSTTSIILLISFNLKFFIFYNLNSKFKIETNLILDKMCFILRVKNFSCAEKCNSNKSNKI